MNALETTALIIAIVCIVAMAIILISNKPDNPEKWTLVHAHNALKKNRKQLENLHYEQQMLEEKILELKRKRLEILAILENKSCCKS